MNQIGPNQEPQLPTISELDSAFIELQEYNDKHTGMGKAMGNMLLGLFRIEGEQENAPQQDPIGEADIAKDIVKMTSSHVFEAAGLTLMDSGGFQGAGTEQTPAISNPSLFSSFLGTIKDDLGDLPSLERGVVGVFNKIVNTTISAAGSEDEEKQALSREGAKLVERIAPDYIRLAEQGVDVDLESAMQVLNWASRPEFNDFFRAQQLMGKEGSFGLAEWHLDASADYYNRRWGNVFDQYDAVCQRYGKDNDLAVLMASRISEGIKAGQEWLEKKADLTTPYVKNLIDPMKQASARAKELGLV